MRRCPATLGVGTRTEGPKQVVPDSVGRDNQYGRPGEEAIAYGVALPYSMIRPLCGPTPMTVRDIMTRHVETASPDETVADVRSRFYESGFRHLPVVDGERLLGIVSDRDVLRAAGPALGLTIYDDSDSPDLERPLAEIMTRDVLTADPTMSVEEAADTMLNYELSALLVLDEDRLVGIVTTADMLRVAAGQEREF